MRTIDRTNNAGFTLLEMLIVIAVLGILASFMAPTLGSSFNQWRAERFSKTLWSSLRTARMKSIASNRAVQAKIKMGLGTGRVEFYINKNEDYTLGSGEWKQLVSLPVIRTPEGVNLKSVGHSNETGKWACLVFRTDGSVYDVGTTSAGSLKCDNTDRGNPTIHVTPGNPPLENGQASTFRTIKIFKTPNTAIPQPVFISYGAYDEFSCTLAKEPPC